MHLQNEASDHCMLLLDTEPKHRKWKHRFSFDKNWVQHKEVRGIIASAWGKQQRGSRGFRLKQKIKECRMALLQWRRHYNANVKTQIWRIKKEITEVHRGQQ